MNLKNTILYAIRYYQMPTREQILSHLFFTVGNGYSWSKGELKHSGSLFRGDPLKKSREFHERFFSSLLEKESFRDQALSMIEEGIEKDRAIIETAEERVNPGYPHVYRNLNYEPTFWNSDFICSIDKYSAINNIPEDVKKNWLLGAFEALELILQTPSGLDVKRYSENLEKASRIKENLLKRFPQKKKSQKKKPVFKAPSGRPLFQVSYTNEKGQHGTFWGASEESVKNFIKEKEAEGCSITKLERGVFEDKVHTFEKEGVTYTFTGRELVTKEWTFEDSPETLPLELLWAPNSGPHSNRFYCFKSRSRSSSQIRDKSWSRTGTKAKSWSDNDRGSTLKRVFFPEKKD